MADATARDVGEFGLIGQVLARLAAAPHVLLGPGDDAAVVAVPDRRVVATTDLLVEGVHFRRDWSTGYDVGRKAAAASLADVAAMGARATALLVGLATPPELEVAWLLALTDGLRDEAALTGAAVVGGDVVRSDTLVVSVTALGDLAGRAPVTRAGARPGDVVVLAGQLGRSAAGLALLLDGERTGDLVDAHRRPTPPYPMGPLLAHAGATSMCDVSDGLLADLGHVAEASQVAIVLDPADELFLTGGEDHALVATLPATATLPAGVRVIGRVFAGGPAVTVAGAGTPERHGPSSNAVRATPPGIARPAGWDHFA